MLGHLLFLPETPARVSGQLAYRRLVWLYAWFSSRRLICENWFDHRPVGCPAPGLCLLLACSTFLSFRRYLYWFSDRLNPISNWITVSCICASDVNKSRLTYRWLKFWRFQSDTPMQKKRPFQRLPPEGSWFSELRLLAYLILLLKKAKVRAKASVAAASL